MRLALLRRLLLVASGLLVLLVIALDVATWRSEELVLFVLPRWVDNVPTLALALFLSAQAIAAARSGLQRTCLVVLPVTFIAALTVGAVFATALTIGRRVEVDRITLPGGRIIVMTVEPLIEETVLDLWEQQGWHWRAIRGTAGIPYSGGKPFLNHPRLIVAGAGRYLLVRWDTLLIDCEITEPSPRPCLTENRGWPTSPDGWRERSARIAAATGEDPS